MRRKLCAFREKDRAFVAALLEAELIDRHVIEARRSHVRDRHASAAAHAAAWLKAL